MEYSKKMTASLLGKRRLTMSGKKSFFLLFVVVLLIPAVSSARDISPFVSIDWLEQNLSNPRLVVVDTRRVEEYKKGHIAGAVSASSGLWMIEMNGLLLELPAEDSLLALIGSLGITGDSMVVAVGKGESDYDRADATRVAWTLLTAGVKNVAVLDGGYAKWLKDKKAVSVDQRTPKAGEYRTKVDRSVIVSKNYVLEKIGKSAILDARIPEVFFGVVTEAFAPKPGHIKSAAVLPAPWAYNKDGILRSKDEIEAMESGIIGKDRSKEVIVYCGVGGYAATWSFLLTEMLGYKNVKFYDGSMQEWIKDPKAPVTVFSWH